MNKKLNLKSKAEVTTKAEEYTEKIERLSINTSVKSLQGSFRVPSNFDYKTELTKALNKKF